jgi:hypothetical protein
VQLRAVSCVRHKLTRTYDDWPLKCLSECRQAMEAPHRCRCYSHRPRLSRWASAKLLLRSSISGACWPCGRNIVGITSMECPACASGGRTYGRGQIQTYVSLNNGARSVIPAASAESVKAIRFNTGSGLSPDIFVLSSIETQSIDVAYRRTIESLTHA